MMIKTEKAVPDRRLSSYSELLFVCLPFCPKRVFEIDEHFSVRHFAAQSTRKLLSDSMTVPNGAGMNMNIRYVFGMMKDNNIFYLIVITC